MQIGLEVLMIEKVHQGDVSFLAIICFPVLGRSKIVFHYLLLKHSTLLLEEVAHNYSGWNKC